MLTNMLFTFQSSAPFELTEPETEYAVNVVKHVYDGHIVFQYNCTNTIPEQLLEDVSPFKYQKMVYLYSSISSIDLLGYCLCAARLPLW